MKSNTDALLTYNNKINSEWNYSVYQLVRNLMRQAYDFAGMYADQLAQPGIYQLSNSLDPAVADPLKI